MPFRWNRIFQLLLPNITPDICLTPDHRSQYSQYERDKKRKIDLKRQRTKVETDLKLITFFCASWDRYRCFCPAAKTDSKYPCDRVVWSPCFYLKFSRGFVADYRRQRAWCGKKPLCSGSFSPLRFSSSCIEFLDSFTSGWTKAPD